MLLKINKSNFRFDMIHRSMPISFAQGESQKIKSWLKSPAWLYRLINWQCIFFGIINNLWEIFSCLVNYCLTQNSANKTTQNAGVLKHICISSRHIIGKLHQNMKSGKYCRPTHIKTKCQRLIFDGNFAIFYRAEFCVE